MSNAWSRPVALTLLRRSEHLLFAALLVVGVAGAWDTGPRRWVLAGGAVLVAGWYLLGMLLSRRRGGRYQAAGWLIVLSLGCAALAVGSVSFVYLAFPLFLLYTQLLPARIAIPAVAVVAAGTIAIIVRDRDRLDAATVVGPLVGAAVAVVITLVYRDLADQVRQREILTDQLAASERRAGVLAERERLAREIHDTVAQSLTSIVLVLRTARNVPAAAGLRTQLDTAIEAANAALTDTRRLIQDLTPTELSGRSLPEALERIVTDPARLHIEGEPVAVATPVAVALLRAAQEALANVRTHAHANRVDVTLTFLPDAVSLDVVDDGIGFDPGLPVGPTTRTGVGLSGVRARAAEVGGSLVIDSAPGRGTALTVTVPLGGVG